MEAEVVEHIGATLDSLASAEAPIKCQRCGAVPMLTGNQYSVRCKKCGLLITLSATYLAILKGAEDKARNGNTRPWHKCNACKDRGFVVMQEQRDNQIGDFAYRCSCSAGDRYSAWPPVPGVVPSAEEVESLFDQQGEIAAG